MMGSIRRGLSPLLFLYSYVSPLLELSIAHYTLYTIHYTLLIIHYTFYTIHYPLLIIHYTLYIIHYTLFR